MDKKAAVRAYAIVIMLMVSVSGAAVAPFLAAMMSGDNSLDNKDPVDCNNGQSGTTLTASKTAMPDQPIRFASMGGRAAPITNATVWKMFILAATSVRSL